tara:strand:+ start:53 stop:217 length:165 start_codon:yes stop_codon:yes gene_type:complete
MFNFVRILFNFKSIKLCCYQLRADVNPLIKLTSDKLKRQAQATSSSDKRAEGII